MTRRLVQIRSKFWRHNPNVLHCTILDMQLENSGVMLSKFCLVLNQASRHKHALDHSWVDLEHIISYRCRTEK
jgi:hypothetical protein